MFDMMACLARAADVTKDSRSALAKMSPNSGSRLEVSWSERGLVSKTLIASECRQSVAPRFRQRSRMAALCCTAGGAGPVFRSLFCVGQGLAWKSRVPG